MPSPAVACLLLLAANPAPAAPSAPSAGLIDALARAYDGASAKDLRPLCTKQLQESLPAATLDAVLLQSRTKYGKLTDRLTKLQPEHGRHVYRGRGERQPVCFSITVDDKGLLSGLQIVPAFLVGLPAGPVPMDDVQRRLSDAVEHTLYTYHVPSISLALVKGDRIVWARALGYQNVAKAVPADPETAYVTGSIFKVVIATALMQYVDEGKLDLDAPVNRYLKGFQVPSRFDKEAPLTVRHLLSHHGGVPNGAQIIPLWERRLPTALDDIIRKQIRVTTKPGQQFQYSNLAYTFNGYLLGVLDGTDCETALRKRLLNPLGMTSTAFTPTAAMGENMAVPYQTALDGKTLAPANRVRLDVYPAGDVYSTPSDMARFLILHLNGGRYGDKQVMSPKSVAEMARPQFAKKGEAVGQGLGWMVGGPGGPRALWHNGAVPGFYTFMVADPERRVGVVLFSNKFNQLGTVLGLDPDPLVDLSRLAIELLRRLDAPAATARR